MISSTVHRSLLNENPERVSLDPNVSPNGTGKIKPDLLVFCFCCCFDTTPWKVRCELFGTHPGTIYSLGYGIVIYLIRKLISVLLGVNGQTHFGKSSNERLEIPWKSELYTVYTFELTDECFNDGDKLSTNLHVILFNKNICCWKRNIFHLSYNKKFL